MSEAIEAAWPVCIGPLQGKKGSMTHEDHITEHLVHALRRTKKVPGRITYQYVLLVEDAKSNVSLTSSIDFVLTVGDDEDVFMNGNNGRARQGLRRVMKARTATLGLTAELDHPSEPGKPTRFSSTHTCTPGHGMRVEHQLLPWP